MTYKLGAIAVIGLAASAAFTAAAAADGEDSGVWDSLFDGKPRCVAVPGATATSRDLNWDDSDRVRVGVLGQASFTPSADNKLHASGDPQVLAHLRVRNGIVELDCRGWRDRTRDMTITLPGRNFRKFELTGGKLVLDRLNQNQADIKIAGSGSVKANGRIDSLKLEIAGSGDGDFNSLTARDADMDIAGSGSITANGKIDDLKIRISGSGRAELGQMETRNAQVQISGSGTARGKGRIDDLTIGISGSGRADFGQMQTRTAKVKISGQGNIDIAPSEAAMIEVSGSGDITLHSSPRQLETNISGSGRIHRLPPAG
jgi:hypothetical protein